MANGLKLEGQRFGHLTVLKKLDERENRYVVWLCRCDCGNEIKVNTRHLMRGTVKDCGCIPENSSRRGPVAEDLTGRRFGKLVAVKKLESKNVPAVVVAIMSEDAGSPTSAGSVSGG